jgi:glutathione S-transferase
MERYRLQEWLAFINSELHKTFSPFFNPGLPDDMRPILVDRLNKRLSYVDSVLANRLFLMGDKLTIADCYLIIVCTWAPQHNYNLAQFENLYNWFKRVGSRRSVCSVIG